MDELNLDLTPEEQKLADQLAVEIKKQLQRLSEQAKTQNDDENIANFSLYPEELTVLFESIQEAGFEPQDVLNKIASVVCKPGIRKQIELAGGILPNLTYLASHLIKFLVVESGEGLNVVENDEGLSVVANIVAVAIKTGLEKFCERHKQN